MLAILINNIGNIMLNRLVTKHFILKQELKPTYDTIKEMLSFNIIKNV